MKITFAVYLDINTLKQPSMERLPKKFFRGKAGTHQADFKELASTKADGVVALCLQCQDQKTVLEHTAQTRADCKLTRAFCTYMRGIRCLY